MVAVLVGLKTSSPLYKVRGWIFTALGQGKTGRLKSVDQIGIGTSGLFGYPDLAS